MLIVVNFSEIKRSKKKNIIKMKMETKGGMVCGSGAKCPPDKSLGGVTSRGESASDAQKP